MEIIGSHDNGFVEDYSECKLIFEKGIIGVYAIGQTNFHKLNQPLNDKKWEFRKINWKENKPVKPTQNDIRNPNVKWIYSHVVEYKTQNKEKQRIFIKPTRDEIIELKAQQRKYWILQTKYQKQIIIALLILTLGWIVNIIFKAQ